MDKIRHLLRMKHNNRSYREIANSLQMSMSTVADYVKRAHRAQLVWPLPDTLSDADLRKHFWGSPVAQEPLVPDWEKIHKELKKKGITRQLLWEEYRAEHLEHSWGYDQFCRAYRVYKKSLEPSMRQQHKAGEKVFVDYAGMTMTWYDIHDQPHNVQIFVGCLGASHYIFVEATATQTLPDWIQSSMHMLEYFKGVPEVIVLDNLKSGVTKAHIYDPAFNPNYQHFAEHYDTTLFPTRPRTPKDKSKVEGAVQCVERQMIAPFRHHRFQSLGEINAAIKQRCMAFNSKPFQRMTDSRHDLWETLDKPALKPLPSTRYAYADWKKAKVARDYHITHDHHAYSVPYRYIGKVVRVCITPQTIACFYEGERIAVHERRYDTQPKGGRQCTSTLIDHMPPTHQHHLTVSDPTYLRQQAQAFGPHAEALIEAILASRLFREHAYRRCLGILRLEKRYGKERLNKACAQALELGMLRYQEIANLLKQGEAEPLAQQTIVHANIRGATYYQS